MNPFAPDSAELPVEDYEREIAAMDATILRDALIKIGRLCLWTCGGILFGGQPLEDMRKIRRIAEEATGISFAEYT